jgi:hypothetical protein
MNAARKKKLSGTTEKALKLSKLSFSLSLKLGGSLHKTVQVQKGSAGLPQRLIHTFNPMSL